MFYCASCLFQVLFLSLSLGLAFWAPGWTMWPVSCLGNCLRRLRIWNKQELPASHGVWAWVTTTLGIRLSHTAAPLPGSITPHCGWPGRRVMPCA
jgi:hypothetical protein